MLWLNETSRSWFVGMDEVRALGCFDIQWFLLVRIHTTPGPPSPCQCSPIFVILSLQTPTTGRMQAVSQVSQRRSTNPKLDRELDPPPKEPPLGSFRREKRSKPTHQGSFRVLGTVRRRLQLQEAQDKKPAAKPNEKHEDLSESDTDDDLELLKRKSEREPSQEGTGLLKTPVVGPGDYFIDKIDHNCHIIRQDHRVQTPGEEPHKFFLIRCVPWLLGQAFFIRADLLKQRVPDIVDAFEKQNAQFQIERRAQRTVQDLPLIKGEAERELFYLGAREKKYNNRLERRYHAAKERFHAAEEHLITVAPEHRKKAEDQLDTARKLLFEEVRALRQNGKRRKRFSELEQAIALDAWERYFEARIRLRKEAGLEDFDSDQLKEWLQGLLD